MKVTTRRIGSKFSPNEISSRHVIPYFLNWSKNIPEVMDNKRFCQNFGFSPISWHDGFMSFIALSYIRTNYEWHILLIYIRRI